MKVVEGKLYKSIFLRAKGLMFSRPKTIIIHDNLLKKIYFIINCFADEKIDNYQKYNIFL